MARDHDTILIQRRIRADEVFGSDTYRDDKPY